jgi:hypothetical protein
MVIKKESSRIFMINLFADFVLLQIPKNEQSIIKIVDCKNFLVIKGITTSKVELDISEICKDFSDKYSDYLKDNKITHTIDLIEYDKEIKPLEELSHTYHNSENCSYHHKEINYFNKNNTSCYYNYSIKEVSDENLVLCSSFPHGYSLGQGRLLYYYGKHIFYNIPPNYPVNTLTFHLSTKKDEEDLSSFSVYNNDLESEDETIHSWALDNFDFNMDWLSTEMEKLDWTTEIINPFQEYGLIKKRNGDFVII